MTRKLGETRTKVTATATGTVDGRLIQSLELAGWGGGPGMQSSIHLKGQMTCRVLTDGTGMLAFECMAQIEVPGYLGSRMGGESRIVNQTAAWTLKPGTIFFVHPSAVRIMG